VQQSAIMGRSVRSLAAEADLTVRECLHQLHQAGLRKVVGGRRLDGHDLSRARAALGLSLQRSVIPDTVARRMLDEDELLVRLLRPLRRKGKVGREHTTPIEHLYGHGVPDHQKARAKELAEALLTRGCLAEKVSQGRRHVWLTTEGLARLAQAERPLAA
jgi:hypothetical protein